MWLCIGEVPSSNYCLGTETYGGSFSVYLASISRNVLCWNSQYFCNCHGTRTFIIVGSNVRLLCCVSKLTPQKYILLIIFCLYLIFRCTSSYIVPPSFFTTYFPIIDFTIILPSRSSYSKWLFFQV
jgi:hypothetical protein